ncbi:MAG: DUF1684 domain-containing protein [Solirubrobacterales bacterium]
MDTLELLDWKLQVLGIYAAVRAAEDPGSAWAAWRAERDRLFRDHPQSPLLPEARGRFDGLHLYDYDPSLRVLGEVREAEAKRYEIGTSGDGTVAFTRFAVAGLTIGSEAFELEIYWLEGYGGGLFLPFADATSGDETYGAGRYLYDTVKGADLGIEGGKLVCDFNFAYNPSCSYDPRWVCPLAPPANRIGVAIRAGERAPG